MFSYKYIILGGGTVAGYAARNLAKQNLPKDELAIISDEAIPPMNRIPYSKDYLQGKSGLAKSYINSPSFYYDKGIKLFFFFFFTEVDFNNRTLTTSMGDIFKFEKLLIATGSHLIPLPGDPGTYSNLFYLRRYSDADKIREGAKNAQNIVVIGGGYIATEVAASLMQFSTSVSMVFPEKHLLQRIVPEKLGNSINEYYQAKGIQLIAGRMVDSLKGRERLESITLDNGEALSADMFVTGIGVKPAISLFENTGLELDRGIVVNDSLETNIEGVYAAGDVAVFPDSMYGPKRLEHWKNAFDQGKLAAQVMSGKDKKIQSIPYFFSDFFDFNLEIYGYPEEGKEVIWRGDPESKEFVVCWMKESVLTGALLQSEDSALKMKIQQYIKKQTKLDINILQDPTAAIDEAAG